MKKPFLRKALTLILTVLCTTALIMGVSIARDGMYLLGVPAFDQVTQVEVASPALTDEVKVISDAESIVLAVKLTGFLRYAPLRQAETPSDSAITLTYHLADGSALSVCADETSVLWRGNAHAVKDTGMFVQCAQAIYFFGEVAEADAQR